MEKCDKCGEIGEDRRTLWMACFYAMDELPVPFEQVAICGTLQQKTGEEQSDIFEHVKYPVFTDHPEATEQKHGFFTLRVCKECRASWMEAISNWFNSGSKHQEPTGTGVYCRKNGTNHEMSEEEIKTKWPDA